MFKNKYLLLIVIGISNGMIPLLIGSSLFVWLKESGLNLQSIGLYGLANLPFALSFAISACLEFLSYQKLVSYKTILVISLITAAACVGILPSQIHNSHHLFLTCLILSLASTIARIISTALQKTLFSEDKLVIVMNVLTISYKCGILIAGSLALYLSQYHTWANLYHSFACLILVFSLLILAFPKQNFIINNNSQHDSIWQLLINPFTNLVHIPQIWLILGLMICYRAPDNLITNYFDLFYLHFGMTKTTVALGYKLYGMILASLGGVFCIRLIRRNSYIYNLNLALILHFISYLMIYWFSQIEAPRFFFYLCVSSEEFSRGMTMITFWTFQTHICKRQHVIIQLAIFTGLDSLSYSLLSSIGGGIINHIGYANFILVVIASFIPAFLTLSILRNKSNY